MENDLTGPDMRPENERESVGMETVGMASSTFKKPSKKVVDTRSIIANRRNRILHTVVSGGMVRTYCDRSEFDDVKRASRILHKAVSLPKDLGPQKLHGNFDVPLYARDPAELLAMEKEETTSVPPKFDIDPIREEIRFAILNGDVETAIRFASQIQE